MECRDIHERWHKQAVLQNQIKRPQVDTGNIHIQALNKVPQHMY